MYWGEGSSRSVDKKAATHWNVVDSASDYDAVRALLQDGCPEGREKKKGVRNTSSSHAARVGAPGQIEEKTTQTILEYQQLFLSVPSCGD